MNRNISRAALAASCATLISACTLTSTVVPNTTGTTTQQTGVQNPIIQALAPNPTSVVHQNDVMTFTVTAYAPDGSPLSYTWTATKGYLSATAGQTVTWTPQNSDGSVVTGLATVQVLVSNSKGGTAQGSVNLMINSDGSASKQ